ncbi:MAG TPA: phosphopantetheine-binding protein [Methylocystis sp.]
MSEKRANLATPAEELTSNSDLYLVVGMKPFAAIQLMLALEKEFEIEFPRRMLNRQSMSSLGTIRSCIEELQENETLRKAA